MYGKHEPPQSGVGLLGGDTMPNPASSLLPSVPRSRASQRLPLVPGSFILPHCFVAWAVSWEMELRLLLPLGARTRWWLPTSCGTVWQLLKKGR